MASMQVLDKLRKAEAIFMAGGDQSEYLDYWRNTEVGVLVCIIKTSIPIP